ncbi:GlxA family transcriptional regulator [Rugamonas sp. CCM 8940]|uniref:GlxA family transcriptional regulator n=1 Tax=Rugamonas sp. CCM 8940 TaxID=2765359 RepID=UPI0018F795E1|nr:helix-turn-helix domain-containing protein [Rugamonas sp. CCM 8940]MBJ7312256.1 helix-turn-helix domain-containing protein [Rugamonas sp. CCM 8940]
MLPSIEIAAKPAKPAKAVKPTRRAKPTQAAEAAEAAEAAQGHALGGAAPAGAGEHTVALLAFDGISPFHLSVPCMVFGDDLARLGVPRYRLLLCAETPGSVRTMSGFNIEVEHDLSALALADTVIVPAWPDPEQRPPQALLAALCAAHVRGARIVGLCLGAFVLAEAGLLDGRVASTHWVWSDDFARKYPRVKLDRKVLYVDDGDILTSAGTAAAIDCCLHLLRRDHGAEVANKIARRMVVAPHRHGGQAQYIEQPLPLAARADQLSDTLDWAAANLAQPHTLDLLAARAAMSRRNFTRRFKQSTGTTVAQWLLNHRLGAAQRLLETSDVAIDRIAEQIGFGSTASLRQHFSAAYTLSPAAYRKQYRR